VRYEKKKGEVRKNVAKSKKRELMTTMTAMIFRVNLTASVHSEVTNFAAPDFVDFRVTHAINTVCASLSYFSFSVFSLILSLFQEKGEGKRFGLSFSR